MATTARKPYIRPATITVEGRLTRDAEVKLVGEGDSAKTLMKFAIAFDGPQKVNAEGSQTSFFECESWNEKQISLFRNSLLKGVEVQVTGRPYVHTYTHREYPVKVTVPKIAIESIKLLARPVRAEGSAQAGEELAVEA